MAAVNVENASVVSKTASKGGWTKVVLEWGTPPQQMSFYSVEEYMWDALDTALGAGKPVDFGYDGDSHELQYVTAKR